jgi:type I restriction enzyme S subunit
MKKFKSVPVNWSIKELGEVCSFENGDRGENYPSRSEYVTQGIPFINAGHLEDGRICPTNLNYISRERFNLLSRGKIKKDDILFCLRGSLGKFAIIDDLEEGAIASSLVIIRCGNDLLSRFLVAYLGSNICAEMIQQYSNGAAQPNLSARSLKYFKIPLPPLEEQKRIVAILDEAFEGIDRAIANTEQNLTNAREIFDSYLNRIFTQKGDGWVEKTLHEVSIEFGRGKSKHRPRSDKKLYGGKYPFIQTGDIATANHRIVEYFQTYNELGLSQSKLWLKDTVCIAIVGANIAESAILDFDSCFPDSVIGVVVNPKLANSDYLQYLLRFFKVELKEKGKGTARDNINMGTFANQKFPFPDVPTQIKIASQLADFEDQIQRLEAIYQQKLEALHELKQSILHKAFTGELTNPSASLRVNQTTQEAAA